MTKEETKKYFSAVECWFNHNKTSEKQDVNAVNIP